MGVSASTMPALATVRGVPDWIWLRGQQGWARQMRTWCPDGVFECVCSPSVGNTKTACFLFVGMRLKSETFFFFFLFFCADGPLSGCAVCVFKAWNENVIVHIMWWRIMWGRNTCHAHKKKTLWISEPCVVHLSAFHTTLCEKLFKYSFKIYKRVG